MDRIVLKSRIIEKIKEDGLLFGKVSDALGISPASLPRLVYNNDEKLTQARVLKVIKEHIGTESDSELLEEITDDKAAASETNLI